MKVSHKAECPLLSQKLLKTEHPMWSSERNAFRDLYMLNILCYHKQLL